MQPSPTEEGVFPGRFWHARCAGRHKAWLLLILIACFLTQSALVYTDHTRPLALDPSARRGRVLWQQHNCQVCHQLYGFGGFLGPDLTNAAGRLTRGQLAQQVVRGNDQMPAFALDDQQLDDLWAFLLAMNTSGQGQARQTKLANERTVIEQVIDQTIEDMGDGTGGSDIALIRQGFGLYRTGTCTSCHVYFARSAVDAPDLSRRVEELDKGALAKVLAQGKPPRMPKPELDAGQQRAMAAFLRFLGNHRNGLLNQLDARDDQPFFSSLPWWEYR